MHKKGGGNVYGRRSMKRVTGPQMVKRPETLLLRSCGGVPIGPEMVFTEFITIRYTK